MFSTKDSIKFMMAKIFFTLADFSFNSITSVEPLHYHGALTIEIKFIKNGKGKIIINDEIHEIDKNFYIVVPEFVSYSLIPETTLDVYSIYLLVDKTSGYKEYIPYLSKYFVGLDKYNLGVLFDDLLYEFKNRRFGYNEIVVSNFKNIIVKILRNADSKGDRLSHWDTESLQYEIENILYNEFATITITEISNRLHLSPRELQRYLLKNYNKSFRELKAYARMSYASNKLIYTDIKIADLAIETGYSTTEHFSFAFKEYFKETPYQYRIKNKKETKEPIE